MDLEQFRSNLTSFYTMFQKGDKRGFTFFSLPDAIFLDDEGQEKIDGFYLMYMVWASSILAQSKPAVHVDIGGSLPWLVTLAQFIPVKAYDIRKIGLNGIPGLETGQADLVKLPFADNSIQSLSCLHTVEHVGLGRYGDLLDPDGDIKAMRELQRVLAPGGQLLFSVPMGRPAIFYNAHRQYSFDQIMKEFYIPLVHFGLISFTEGTNDLSFVINDSPKKDIDKESTGCFLFKKEASA